MFSHRIVVSAITYSEMRFGASGPKASPRHVQLVDKFCRARCHPVLGPRAVDGTTDIKVALRQAGTRSARTIRRLPGLKLEDWVN